MELRKVLRQASLPVLIEFEQEAVEKAKAALTALGIEESDMSTWLALEFESWKTGATASPAFRSVVEEALTAGAPGTSVPAAQVYFRLHSQLMKRHQLTHNEATAVLSHMFFMHYLATAERMSSARISQVMHSRTGDLPVLWQVVAEVLRGIGVRQDLEEERVQVLFAEDQHHELAWFADADLSTAISQVARFAKSLGYPGSMEDDLGVLLSGDSGGFGPYLQIIHFACTIGHFYDHALTHLYTFNPRGRVANWLFGRYPSILAPAGNPVLNNAKSVDRLDHLWARSKKGNWTQATALVDILSNLEELGCLAKQELCAAIRCLLLRVIRLHEEQGAVVPESLPPDHALRLLEAIGVQETRTTGVLEQRAVDAAAAQLHPEADGWRSRGLGDSVNTNNLSRRKLGDCDFQHAEEKRVVAYEAHAGRLTNVYVDGHVTSLHRTMELRAQEMEGIAALPDWRVEVVFVAHDVGDIATRKLEICDVPITIGVERMSDFLVGPDAEQRITTQQKTASVNQFVLRPIRERRTPDPIRQALKALAGIE